MLAHPWREVELALTSEHDYPNGYTDVEVWAEFTIKQTIRQLLQRRVFGAQLHGNTAVDIDHLAGDIARFI